MRVEEGAGIRNKKTNSIHDSSYCKTPLISTYVFSGLATEQELIFRAVLIFGGMIRRRQKSCKEGVCSIQCFPHTRRCCACFSDYVHTSRIQGYLYSGGGGYELSGHCNQQQISVKTEGYLFSEGYLFTGFYGIASRAWKIVFVSEKYCGAPIACCSTTSQTTPASPSSCTPVRIQQANLHRPEPTPNTSPKASCKAPFLSTTPCHFRCQPGQATF